MLIANHAGDSSSHPSQFSLGLQLELPASGVDIPAFFPAQGGRDFPLL
jgi:hypothetical protein